MEEIRVITGGMDLDSAPEYISEGDYGESVNIRSRVSSGQSSGRLSFWNDFVPANDSVNLPPGDNKTLRTVVNDAEDRLYAVNYNSQGRHTIVEYTDNSGQILFTNMSDTDDKDLLGFSGDTYLNDLVLHQNRWLIFTDTQSEVKMFDIDKLKSGYGRALIEQDVVLAKAPPLSSPGVEYVDSTSIRSNNLLNKLFKFKYKYVYEGGFESAWSATSAELLPNNLNEVNNGITSNRQNLLRVSLKLDSPGIEKVIVAASSNGSEWVSLRDMRVSDIIQLPATRSTDSDEIYTGDTWVMSFYNPFAFNLITADEADHSYDAIPQRVNTLDVVNNNTLLLGGLHDGYKRLPSTDVTLTPVRFSAGNYSTIIGRGTLQVQRINIVEGWGSPYYNEYVYIQLQGTPVVGDIVSIITNYGVRGELNNAGTIGNAETAEVFEYKVGETDTSLTALYGNLARILPNGQVFSDDQGEFVGFHYPAAENVEGYRNFKTLDRVDIDLNDIGYVDVPTKRTFKKGSTVQFALCYRDRFGRYFPLETSSDYIVSFPHHSTVQMSRFGYKLDWTINHQPPQGASSYQWMVSPDMKHQSYVDLLGDFKKDLSKIGKYIVLDLNSLNRYVNRGIPGVNYSYTPGDRVYILNYWLQGDALEAPGFAVSGLELGVMGMDVSAITEYENRYLLKIEYNQELWGWLTGLTNTGEALALKIQIYTPRVTDPNMQTTIFREIGPTYSIVDGNHSVTSGQLEGIDDFIRGRVFEAFPESRALGFAVEDRNITDDTASLVPFRGNVRTYDDQVEDLDLRGSIRFSDVGRINSPYNGINRFFEGRIYGEGPGETTAKHGAITKMKIVGNYLKVLQENEVGIIPVYLSMIQDNSGGVQTADSDKILNTVRYIGEGKIGSGVHAKSFSINQRGTIYFFDNDRKIPFMLQGLGLTDISSKCASYFSTKVVDTLVGSNLHPPHREYWLTLIDADKGPRTMMFDELTNRWVTFSSNIPDSVTNLNGEVYSFKGGTRYRLLKESTGNSFYGEQYDSSVKIIFGASFVRTFQSLAVHSQNLPRTSEDGIETELDLVSDLVEKDFKFREGIWYANFLRDKRTGLYTGKFLKGKWIKINLEFSPKEPRLDLLKIVVKSKGSTANE